MCVKDADFVCEVGGAQGYREYEGETTGGKSEVLTNWEFSVQTRVST